MNFKKSKIFSYFLSFRIFKALIWSICILTFSFGIFSIYHFAHNEDFLSKQASVLLSTDVHIKSIGLAWNKGKLYLKFEQVYWHYSSDKINVNLKFNKILVRPGIDQNFNFKINKIVLYNSEIEIQNTNLIEFNSAIKEKKEFQIKDLHLEKFNNVFNYFNFSSERNIVDFYNLSVKCNSIFTQNLYFPEGNLNFMLKDRSVLLKLYFMSEDLDINANVLIPDVLNNVYSINAIFNINKIQNLQSYVPKHTLNRAFISWAHNAILNFNKFRMFLNINNRNFRSPDVVLYFSELNLKYNKSWQPLKNLSGYVLCKDDKLLINNAVGSLYNNTKINLNAFIPILKKYIKAVMQMHIIFNSNIKDFASFLSDISYISDDKFLDNNKLQSSGNVNGYFNVILHLEDKPMRILTEGDIGLYDNSISLELQKANNKKINIQKLNGSISFKNKNFYSNKIDGYLNAKKFNIYKLSNLKNSLKIQLLYNSLPVTFEYSKRFMQLCLDDFQLRLNGCLKKQNEYKLDIHSIDIRYLIDYLNKNKENSKFQIRTDDLYPGIINIDNIYYNNSYIASLDPAILNKYKNCIDINNMHFHSDTIDILNNFNWCENKLINNSTELNNVIKFNGVINILDIESLLDKFKSDHFGISAKKAKIKYNFVYNNIKNLKNKILSIQGKAHINFKNGVIDSTQIKNSISFNFGKLLNVLSVESIINDFKLNLSRTYNKGFAYDFIKGDIFIDRGILKVSNLQINGPVANVNANGSINVLNHSYDMNVAIQPNLTSSLPVVVAFTSGPLLGIATVVANKIFNPVIGKFTKRIYKFHGNSF